MKLSLVLSSLLLGTSLMFSGCGSDDDVTPDATGTTADSVVDSVVTEVAETFKASAIAGKTLSVYGYSDDGTAGDSQVEFSFSDDGKTATVQEFSGEMLSENATVKIEGNTIIVSEATETLVTWKVVDANTDGIYVYFNSIPGDKTDPYPAVLAFEAQADEGKVLLEAFANATEVTNAKITNTQYSVVLNENGQVRDCILSVLSDDGTYTGSQLGESWSGTYSTANNTITYTFSDEDGTFSDTDTVLLLTDNLMISQWNSDEGTGKIVGLGYTNKQDAIDFALSYGKDCSGEFEQLEQP